MCTRERGVPGLQHPHSGRGVVISGLLDGLIMSARASDAAAKPADGRSLSPGTAEVHDVSHRCARGLVVFHTQALSTKCRL